MMATTVLIGAITGAMIGLIIYVVGHALVPKHPKHPKPVPVVLGGRKLDRPPPMPPRSTNGSGGVAGAISALHALADERRTHKQRTGEWVRYMRTHAGLTQYELAELIGTQTAFVSAMETGRRPLPAATLERLDELVLSGMLADAPPPSP